MKHKNNAAKERHLNQLYADCFSEEQAVDQFDHQLTVVIPSGNGEGDWEPNEKRTRVKNHRLVTLTAVIGATDFDNPAPCITIMKPHDD